MAKRIVKASSSIEITLMNLEELQKKYSLILSRLKVVGFRNKLVLFLLSFPASLYAYFYMDSCFFKFHLGKEMPHSLFIVLMIGLEILMALAIFSMKSISYVNSRRVNMFKLHFKAELFEYIRREIPEIDNYLFNQKINPRIFYESTLFEAKYGDYKGDDWVRGHFANASFELCELHVFNLSKRIFFGIFAWLRSKANSVDFAGNLKKHSVSILTFEKTYGATILTSSINDRVFVAFKMEGKFFEADTIESIRAVSRDVQMLKDIVGLLKLICSNE